MQIGDKQLFVVGDRILIRPNDPEERTKVGLYLPQTVVEKQPVQSGRVVEVGPGVAFPSFQPESSEPWKQARESPVRYIPVQAEVGDIALFLKKDAVEIQFQEEDYLVIPQAAVLLLIRGEEAV